MLGSYQKIGNTDWFVAVSSLVDYYRLVMLSLFQYASSYYNMSNYKSGCLFSGIEIVDSFNTIN